MKQRTTGQTSIPLMRGLFYVAKVATALAALMKVAEFELKLIELSCRTWQQPYTQVRNTHAESVTTPELTSLQARVQSCRDPEWSPSRAGSLEISGCPPPNAAAGRLLLGTEGEYSEDHSPDDQTRSRQSSTEYHGGPGTWSRAGGRLRCIELSSECCEGYNGTAWDA